MDGAEEGSWPTDVELPLAEAEKLVRRVRASTLACARSALEELLDQLADSAEIKALALPEPRNLPSRLAEVLASQKSVYTADRHMYEASLAEAAASLDIRVVTHRRSAEFEFAGSAVGLPADSVRSYVRGLRKRLGAPWQKDHQSAAAAAIGVLAREAGLTLGEP